MKFIRITATIILLLFIFKINAQTIDFIFSSSNNKLELYDIYGLGIGVTHKLKSKIEISARYLFEYNENKFIHVETPLIIDPSTPLIEQQEFSHASSIIKNHLIGISFMYITTNCYQ